MNKRIKKKHQKKIDLHNRLLLAEYIGSWKWLPDFGKAFEGREIKTDRKCLYNEETKMWQWSKPLNEQ